jgi:hypothetical protein
VNRGPRSLAELRGNLAENHRQLAQAPQIEPRPLQGLQPYASDPPRPGTLAFMEAERQRLRAAPDLRTDARAQVDAVWERARDWVMQQHGRVLSCDPWDQATREAEIAVRAAQRAAETYIRVGLSPHTSKATREAALGNFCELVTVWLNLATRGWESAQQLAEREAREEQEAWRR